MYLCKECNFLTENGKIWANHIRWKHKKEPFSKEGYERLRQSAMSKHITKILSCEGCGNIFELTLTEASWRKKKHLFCSRSCANKREMNEKTKQKIKDAYENRIKGGLLLPESRKEKVCLNCGNKFIGKRKYCSDLCLQENRIKKNDSLISYRNQCRFTFSIKKYSEEFNFSLIEKYGWYSASNHGNNLYGVSRDHQFSVKEGYEKKIDPKIIKHPANCKLLLHSENSSKGSKSSITYEELLKRIEEWNKKYS